MQSMRYGEKKQNIRTKSSNRHHASCAAVIISKTLQFLSQLPRPPERSVDLIWRARRRDDEHVRPDATGAAEFGPHAIEQRQQLRVCRVCIDLASAREWCQNFELSVTSKRHINAVPVRPIDLPRRFGNRPHPTRHSTQKFDSVFCIKGQHPVTHSTFVARKSHRRSLGPVCKCCLSCVQ